MAGLEILVFERHLDNYNAGWRRGGFWLCDPAGSGLDEGAPNNPMMQRPVRLPIEWPWSSWRFYFLEDASLIAMDRPE